MAIQNYMKNLKKKIQQLRNNRENVVILPDIGPDGRSRSATVNRENYTKAITYDKDGKRQQYYDNDQITLEELVKREKRSGFEDYDSQYANNIMKNSRYKDRSAMEPDFDDEFVDYKQWEKKSGKRKKTPQQISQRERKEMIADYQKQSSKEANCYFCFENKKIPKHLLVSLGNLAYLLLPVQPICEGHCIISPIIHQSGGTVSMEADLWLEVNEFMKCITRMNYKKNQGTLFIETFLDTKNDDHSIIECIPLPEKIAADAPVFFKKAISESDSRWTNHKKLYETGPQGARKCLAKSFPYFFVQFGMTFGMAHIIEKKSKFSKSFGLEVVAGIIGNTDFFTEGIQTRPARKDELERTKKFLESWLPFDWTTELDGGEIKEIRDEKTNK